LAAACFALAAASSSAARRARSSLRLRASASSVLFSCVVLRLPGPGACPVPARSRGLSAAAPGLQAQYVTLKIILPIFLKVIWQNFDNYLAILHSQ